MQLSADANVCACSKTKPEGLLYDLVGSALADQ